jgi:transglutaminase-like putative cysteine protease
VQIGRRSTLGHLDAAASATPTTARLQGIANNDQGTFQTLRIMRNFVRDAVRAPNQNTRAVVIELLRDVPARDWSGEVHALHRFVRDEIRYMMDPGGEEPVELVQTCDKTLELQTGDCDDKSTLLAAMLTIAGHPARFAAVGFNGEDFSHVLVQTKFADHWIWLETILSGVPAGWCPAGITKAYFLKV